MPALPSFPPQGNNTDINLSAMTGDIEAALKNLETDLGTPKTSEETKKDDDKKNK